MRLALFLCVFGSLAMGGDTSDTVAPPRSILKILSTLPSARLLACRDALEHVHENARVPPERYGQIYYRDLRDIEASFGAGFSRFVQKLPTGSNVLLYGGGLGLYGWNLASRGFRVSMIQPQDFVEKALDSVFSDRAQLERMLATEISSYGSNLETVGLMPVGLLRRFFGALGVELPEGIEPSPPDIALPASSETWRLCNTRFALRFLDRLVDQYELARERTENPEELGFEPVRRIAALVPQGLSQVPEGSVHLGIDHLDWAAYSTQRPEGFSKTYSALAPGGRFYFLSDPIFDFVRLKSNRRKIKFLMPFLAQRFPTVFKRYRPYFQEQPAQVTFLQRDAQIEHLTLEPLLKPKRTWLLVLTPPVPDVTNYGRPPQVIPFTEYWEQ